MKRAATGALLGLAFGDAMGFPTEFNSMAQIEAKTGPWRSMPLPLASGRAYVTDDTQMTLALGEGLLDALAGGPLTAARMEPPVRRRFVDWCFADDNDRAPGGTCLRACEALSRRGRWQDASEIGSKGCGANMRVAPLGLVPGLDARQRSGAAQLQAALTHGHPTALAAADLTAEAVRLLAGGAEPADLVPALTAYATGSRSAYRADWLGDLAARAHDESPAAFAARGWDACLRALGRLEEALADADPEADP
uniref:ADP-ribosylglycohydrolase family protein n=1 Tax=Actinacidiphila rubida TaxID=310780 RepID=UPI00084989EB